jgi:hypothetical protein
MVRASPETDCPTSLVLRAQLFVVDPRRCFGIASGTPPRSEPGVLHDLGQSVSGDALFVEARMSGGVGVSKNRHFQMFAELFPSRPLFGATPRRQRSSMRLRYHLRIDSLAPTTSPTPDFITARGGLYNLLTLPNGCVEVHSPRRGTGCRAPGTTGVPDL